MNRTPIPALVATLALLLGCPADAPISPGSPAEPSAPTTEEAPTPDASALEPGPASPLAPVALTVCLDRSRSAAANDAVQQELLRIALEGLDPNETVAACRFTGVAELRYPPRPSVDLRENPAALEGLRSALGPFDGERTFYSGIFSRVLAQLPGPSGSSASALLVVTDEDGSDPLDQRRTHRTEVDDPDWHDPVSHHVGETRVVWAVIGDAGAVAEGARRWEGIIDEQPISFVWWNPPTGAGDVDSLGSWLAAVRAEAAPPGANVLGPGAAPSGPDPAAVQARLVTLAASLGALLLAVGGWRKRHSLSAALASLGRRRALRRERREVRTATERRAREQQQAAAEAEFEAARQELRRRELETEVRLCPLWERDAGEQSLNLREESWVEVSPDLAIQPHSDWTRMPIPGFELGRIGGRVRLRPMPLCDPVVIDRGDHQFEVEPGEDAALESEDILRTLGGLPVVSVVLDVRESS